MAISKQQIIVPAQLDLPSPGIVYSASYFSQLNAMIRTFLFKLTGILSSLFGPRGGKYLNMPYGSYQSNQTQSVASANTPTLVTFDTVDYENGVSKVTGDGFHVEQSGIYNVQFSAQVTNSDTQIHDFYIWLRKGVSPSAATDIENTASITSVANTHGGVAGYGVIAANFFVELNVDEFVEFWWAANSTQVQINYIASTTSPLAKPGSPAIVATLSYVSNITV